MIKGDVILATSRKEYEVNDPIKIELMALFLGLELCIHMGINNLILKGDFFYGASNPIW